MNYHTIQADLASNSGQTRSQFSTNCSKASGRARWMRAALLAVMLACGIDASALWHQYYLTDQSTNDVRWTADTGRDQQEKFRLNDAYLSGDYWKYFKTNDGTGTVTREKPYVDFTVNLFRDPKDKFINTKDRSGKISASPDHAELFVDFGNGRVKVGEIKQDAWHENCNWTFNANGAQPNAGMATVVGSSNPGRARIHYYPSAEMLKNCKTFQIIVYRKEHFFDSGIFSDDWDHIYYTYYKTYKIDWKDQLTVGATYYKPGQMRFSVEGTPSEFNHMDNYTIGSWYSGKPNKEKSYTVKVENNSTRATTTANLSLNLSRDEQGVVIDLPDYENSREGYTYTYTLTEKGTVKTKEGYEAGFSNLKTEKIDKIPGLLYPKDVTIEFDQFRMQNTLRWRNENWTEDKRVLETTYFIYRRECTDAKGTPARNAKWTYINEVQAKKNNDFVYTVRDNDDVRYRKYYVYRVIGVPNAWNKEGNYSMPTSLTETLPVDAWSSKITNTDPVMTFNDMKQDMTVKDKIRVTWSHTRIPGTNGNVDFVVYRNRASEGPDKWDKVSDEISGPANPSATRRPAYVDEDVESCEQYSYRIEVTSADSTFVSEPIRATLLDQSIVQAVDVTKGKNETTVTVSWDVHQVGNTPTQYLIERRYANSRNENDWQKLTTIAGTASHYIYDDENVEAGRYYSYRVTAQVPDCKNSEEYVFSNAIEQVGYGMCKGIVNGRVTFSTNTGVDNVRISLKSNDEGLDGQLQNYSKHIETETTGICWSDKTKNIQKLIDSKKPVTIQLWVMNESDSETVPLVTLPGMGTVSAKVETNQWEHVSILVKDAVATIIVNADSTRITTQSLSQSEVSGDSATVSFGAGSFRGYLKDIRIWEGNLTMSDIRSNYGRILNGRESGLKLYWPLDEGLQEVAFDVSMTNAIGNNRHAVIDPAITNSTILPSEDQYCLYAITDDKGNYTIRGIPFVGVGSSYTITPSKGIHTFSLPQRNVVVGKGSMALNGIDFTDNSSFTYSGTVRYLNTTIPVDSITFAVDGVTVSKDNKPVLTGADGRFEIAVPIGEHYIEAMRSNHVTSRFPETGTYNFLEEGTVNFSDSTLVNVAGRVNGGIDSQNAPIGFKMTKNRIGRAYITLSLETESNNQFNMRLDGLNGYVHVTDSTFIPSKNDSIVSKNWYSPEDPTKIIITTNEENAEFSAMLPPLRYRIDGIAFDQGSRNNDIKFFNENLPVIDARFKTNSCQDTILTEDMKMVSYESQGRFVLNYRAEPEITVMQDELPLGAFGAAEFTYDVEDKTYPLLKTDADGQFLGYAYSDYPLFGQGSTYTMYIKAEENYYAFNPATGKEDMTSIPVEDGNVHIANEMSINTIVTDKDQTYNGETYPASSVLQTATLDVSLDKQGLVGYKWTCGEPNIQGDHLRYLSISLEANNRSYTWPGPYNTGNLPGIVIGCVSTGTNFVTKTPDKVEFVLRDPGGATSTSFMQKDEITVKTDRTTHGGFHQGSTDIGITIKWGGKLTMEHGEIAGGGVGVVNGVDVATALNTDNSHEITPFVAFGRTSVWDSYHSTTSSFSTRVQTPADDRHVGRAGDTFIGKSKNLFYGIGTYVYLKKQDDGSFKIDTREDIVAQQSDKSTWFVFNEFYVRNTLIPNWEQIRNSFLETVNTIPTTAPDDKLHYYTTLSPDNPNYGQDNTYTRVYNGKGETDIKMDTVSVLNSYVKGWKQVIADNERAKVEAMKSKKAYVKNYSFSGGNSYTYTHTKDSTNTDDVTLKWSATVPVSLSKNFVTNGGGVILTFVDSDNGYQGSDTHIEKNTQKNQVGYTLSDPNKFAALSISVYDDPTGMGGPIFLTQGGQTMCPYEGGSKVEFYEDALGKELDAPTAMIEKCDLLIDNPVITDVLTGETAFFKLRLMNNSETQTTSAYRLMIDPDIDMQGADIQVDGQFLTDGSIVLVLPPGETEKTLSLRQTDHSVTKYDLRMCIRSSNDPVNVYSDYRTMTASFIPSAASVNLATDHNILNSEMKDGLKVTLSDLDRQFSGLKGVRIQYRRQGSNNWILAKEWVFEKYKTQHPTAELLPASGNLVHNMHFDSDGTYELRAQTFALYGENDVTRETSIKTIIQDTDAPKLLGTVNGVNVNINNVEDMCLTFNQDINTAALSKEENLNVTGYQNNTPVKSAQAGIPDVAMQLSRNEVSTQQKYDLGVKSDLAFDFLYYRQSDGNIIFIGSKQNRIALGTTDGGKLYATIGDTTYVSETVVKAGEWCHLALSYHASDVNEPLLTVGMASNNADEQQMVFLDKPVRQVSISGNLTLGSAATEGRICHLSLWSSNRSVRQAYAEKDVMKPHYLSDILGYWLMDEGHGTVLTDRARNHTITMNADSWFYANKNLAAHLDGSKPMQLGFASASLSPRDNFMAEMWFRADAGNKANSNATLFSTTNNVSLGFKNGSLVLSSYVNSEVPNAETDTTLTVYTGRLIDNNWHHLAISTLRGTSASFLIDGKVVRSLNERYVPAIQGAYIYLGGQESQASTAGAPVYEKCFTGDIDEFRFGLATRSNNLIDEQRYERLPIPADSIVEGLALYYPMETTRANSSGTVETVFDPTNKLKMSTLMPEDNSHLTEATTAPPLKNVSTMLRLDDADYDIVTNDRTIYFHFPTRSYAKMHGNDYTFTLSGVKDEYGNTGSTISWNAHFELSLLEWSSTSYHYVKKTHETIFRQLSIFKNGSQALTYQVKGAPSWIKIDQPEGLIAPTQNYVDLALTIDNTAPLGKHTVQLYVTDGNGIQTTCVLHIDVVGSAPDWYCDSGEYSNNMTITSQLRIDGHIAENPNSMVGAFDSEGNCRGFAKPEYMESRNAFFVNLMIFGNKDEKIYFKIYDADNDLTHANVNILPDGKTTRLYQLFSPTSSIGTFDQPAIFTTGRNIEQHIMMVEGWNWKSFFVNPKMQGAVSYVLGDISEEIQTVKSKTQMADNNNGQWNGTLTKFESGKMYKFYCNVEHELVVTGELTNTATPIAISKGWNWIGSTSHYNIPVGEAFLNLNPQKDDYVKGKTTFAVYDGHGQWNGTLTAIEPGEGYKYHAQQAGTLVFPNVSGYASARGLTPRRAGNGPTDDADYSDYSDNMNIVMRIVADGSPVTDATVKAYIDASLRGQTEATGGLYYLTVAGNSTDAGKRLTLVITLDGRELTTDLTDVSYTTDLIKGSSSQPYVLNLDELTGIVTLTAQPEGDVQLFDLSGRRVESPAATGVYIVRDARQQARKVKR